MARLFVSYASEDEAWKDRILYDLRPLEKTHALVLWHDGKLAAGERWDREIRRQLDSADGFLVLASRTYTCKPFIVETEFPALQARIESHGADLFWLPLDDHVCQAKDSTPLLRCLHAFEAAHRELRALEVLNDRAKSPATALSDALLCVRTTVGEWCRAKQARAATPALAAAAALTADVDRRRRQRVERRYATLLSQELRTLTIPALGPRPGEGPALRSLPLERVYFTLQADPTTLAERLEARALHQELAEAEDSASGLDAAIDRVLAKGREREPQSEPSDGALVVEKVFRDERVSVVLGDPGSGKSVLCRWIALQLAKQVLARLDAGAATGDTPVDTPVDLGPARLPILLRAADLNEWARERVSLAEAQAIPGLREVLDVAAARYAERQSSPQQRLDAHHVSRLWHTAIAEQRTALLIDGLDEVADQGQRELVTQMVEDFVRAEVLAAHASGIGPGPGNKVMLTSRITGYHLAPLRLDADAAAHFRIRPLDDTRAADFCQSVAAAFEESSEGAGQGLLSALAVSRLAGLERLKRNPLLLTSLVSFWFSQRRLPASRATLYHALLLDLCGRWRSLDSVRAQLSEQTRAWLQDDEKLLDLLGVIADAIQHDHASGSIARADIERLLRGRVLPSIAGKSELEWTAEETRRFDQDLAALVELIGTQAGALTARGPGVFEFLHLTFREYLVGWRLLAGLGGPAPESVLAERFVERAAEPRWREPLLLAASEIGRRGERGFERERFLAALRELGFQRAPLASADWALFMADVLAEFEPESVGRMELRQGLHALVEAYARHGPLPTAARARERLAERVAELRRRAARASDETSFEGLAFDWFGADPQLSPAWAHLCLQRGWLGADLLDRAARYAERDTEHWGWPMLGLLRRGLLSPGERIEIDPISTLARPASDGSEAQARARRRYDAAQDVWRARRQACDERTGDTSVPRAHFPLGAALAAPVRAWWNLWSARRAPTGWARLAREPECARVLAALLAPCDDRRAAFWASDYRRLAQFLQRGDAAREGIIDADPADFVARWGVDDPVYNCAVYLDTNPGGRFKLIAEAPVEWEPGKIVSAVSQPLSLALASAARALRPARHLSRALRRAQRSPVARVRAEAAVAALATGADTDQGALQTTDGRRVLPRARAALADAVVRGVTQRAHDWLSPDSGLDDAERAAIERALTQAWVSAASMPLSLSLSNDLQRAHLAECAERWARAFDDQEAERAAWWANRFEQDAPRDDGWLSRPTLLSALCCAVNARRLRQEGILPGRPPLWGLSPAERCLAPDALNVAQRLESLAYGRGEMVGRRFVEAFLDAPHGLFSASPPARSLRHTARPGAPAPAESEPARWLELEQAGAWCAAAFAWELHSRDVDDAAAERFAERLLVWSRVDAALFMLRLATGRAADEVRQRRLRTAIGWLQVERDDALLAEILARLRVCVLDDERAIAACRAAAEGIASPVLRAQARGDLPRFLASPEFVWNRTPGHASEPAWVVTAAFMALDAAASSTSDTESLWRDLARDPRLDALERLIEAAGEQGLTCTAASVDAVEVLLAPPVAGALQDHARRLVPLLTRAHPETWPRLETWAQTFDAADASAFRALVARQATLLLAEGRRELDPRAIDALFDIAALDDDYPAIRAELALAGPVRNVRRDARRFRASAGGLQAMAELARRRRAYQRECDQGDLAFVAKLAINDWTMDAPEALGAWCREALAGSDAENLLLTVFDCCDCWSPECQALGAEWLQAGGTTSEERRMRTLVAWAARLAYVKRPDAEPFLLELAGSARAAAPHAAAGTYPLELPSGPAGAAAGNAQRPNLAIVAQACEDASLPAVGPASARVAQALLRARMLPLYVSGTLDQIAFEAYGSNAYVLIGDSPEARFPSVAASLDQAPFRRTLAEWLLVALTEWRAAREAGASRDDVARLTLDALLSFATCLREEAFARLCEPERYLVPLAWVCFDAPTAVAHMSALSLISRLKHVDLDAIVATPEGRPGLTVLDAVLEGLRHNTRVRDRVIDTLPGIRQLRGARVLERLEALLVGAAPSGRLPAGSEVLAAALLTRRLLQTDALQGPAERSRALSALRRAAQAPQHNRPLYRRLGLGDVRANLEDEIGGVCVGALASALRDVAGTI
jgi:hypothetical protein